MRILSYYKGAERFCHTAHSLTHSLTHSRIAKGQWYSWDPLSLVVSFLWGLQASGSSTVYKSMVLQKVIIRPVQSSVSHSKLSSIRNSYLHLHLFYSWIGIDTYCCTYIQEIYSRLYIQSLVEMESFFTEAIMTPLFQFLVLVSKAHDMNIDLELSGLILHDIVDGGYNWQVMHMQWSLPGLGMRWFSDDDGYHHTFTKLMMTVTHRTFTKLLREFPLAVHLQCMYVIS